MSDMDIREVELVGLKVMKTQEHLEAANSALIKSFDLSRPQYNVLRILRGAGSEDLNCHEVKERMITRVPDITRLLDRLENRGLVERWRCTEDRRVVRTRITATGLDLLSRIDQPLQDLWARQFAGFTPRKLAQLDRLLDALLANE